MSDAVCEIGVYSKGQSTQTLPMYRISKEDALDWVYKDRIAEWVNNRHKNIMLLQDLVMTRLRGASCHVTPKMVEDAAAGKPYAVAIIESYA